MFEIKMIKLVEKQDLYAEDSENMTHQRACWM